MTRLTLLAALLLSLGLSPVGLADDDGDAAAEPACASLDDERCWHGMAWRNIGPYRGGRATAVTGVASQPQTFYFGATGGGVWKTEDAGTTWENVSDGFFATGSVGAIRVAPSDPNVVYVGMGESPVRGVATSHGDGVYRSTDGGATWTHLGLEQTRQISAIEVHPTDPDTVWVAAQGNLYRPTVERGIYRSTDGGATWEQQLFVSEGAGASDLVLDPTNPRILYAAFWDHRRLPWQVVSGGEGSGVHKSVDGGATWTELTAGLPELKGKIGLAVAPARPDRVWALVEAEDGGLFRSDDGGESFSRVNGERIIQARSWYYMHVYADPRDADTVYVLNAPMLRSIDGGRTFEPVRTPHGDNHALWIHPDDPDRMINGNDGGANVSFNGGATWSTQNNQPTAQFYRVATDDRFPYWVYGGQQDNSTVAIASQAPGGIGPAHWHAVGGCESAHVAFDPARPDLVYAGCYQGYIDEWERETGRTRSVMAYPVLGLGSEPKDLRYRFNWNAPILVSRHDPGVVYHAGNVVLRTKDRGVSWTEVSPDLTRDEEDKQGPGGAPITNEGAGGETYNTLLSLAESPHDAATLWAGSDDGLVHVTRDGGASWSNVTPGPFQGGAIEDGMFNAIDISPHDPNTVTLAYTRYKLGDLAPYVWRTTDGGTTWSRRDAGLPEDSFVRVVREDPERPGLLYAGTETGVHVSFDAGESWTSLQLELPVVPITDLALRQGDLVAATQGRAFWILDDLAPLRQAAATASPRLIAPKPFTLQVGGGSGQRIGPVGQSGPLGAVIDYLLPTAPEEGDEPLVLEILDPGGETVRRWSSQPEEGREPLPTEAGHNRLVWDLQGEPPTPRPGPRLFVLASGATQVPGTYTVRLSQGEWNVTEELLFRPDPRVPHDADAAREQLALAQELVDTVDAVHRGLERVGAAREQLTALAGRLRNRDEDSELATAAEELAGELEEWSETVYDSRQMSFQDVINYPNHLGGELASLFGAIDGQYRLTAGARERAEDLKEAWAAKAGDLEPLLGDRLEEINRKVAEAAIPAVVLPTDDDAGSSDDDPAPDHGTETEGDPGAS